MARRQVSKKPIDSEYSSVSEKAKKKMTQLEIAYYEIDSDEEFSQTIRHIPIKYRGMFRKAKVDGSIRGAWNDFVIEALKQHCRRLDFHQVGRPPKKFK